MKKANIGAILKKRIKYCGYTQEGFALKVGIGLSTLKKYLSGQIYYDVELLECFAAALDCSYDYLLGKSDTPNPELHTIKEQTGLSDGTIERLITAGAMRPVYEFAIQNDKLMWLLQDYLEFENKVDLTDEDIMLHQDGQLADVFQHGLCIEGISVSIPEIPDLYLQGITRRIIETCNLYGEDIPMTRRLYDIR